MEVIEIISHFINKDSNMLRVEFRCIEDDTDMVRVDTIEYERLQEYGYDDSITYDEFFEEYEDEDEWDYEDEDEEFMDEDELISFLNEYYLVVGKLPDAEYL